MDGLARPVGAGTTMQFDGNTITLPKFTMRDFGLVENHLLRLRRKEYVQLAVDMYGDDSPQIDIAKKEAFQIRTIDSDEAQAFIDSRNGMAFTLWVLLEKQESTRGKYTLERVEEIVLDAADSTFQEMLAARDQVTGVDMAGNSTGPTAPAAETAKESESRLTGEG